MSRYLIVLVVALAVGAGLYVGNPARSNVTQATPAVARSTPGTSKA